MTATVEDKIEVVQHQPEVPPKEEPAQTKLRPHIPVRYSYVYHTVELPRAKEGKPTSMRVPFACIASYQPTPDDPDQALQRSSVTCSLDVRRSDILMPR